MRWATSSGCSTWLVVWAMTPGMRHLPSGSLVVSQTSHSVGVAGIGGFHAVGSGVDAEHDVHDVAQGYVGGVRAVPATPAEVVADAVLGQAFEGVVQGVDAEGGELAGSPRWWERGRGCRTG